MRYLLDANVLIALVNPSHVHHERARKWFSKGSRLFATCPITEGALIRHYFRDTIDPEAEGAKLLLGSIEAMRTHAFWPDELSYTGASFKGVIGHRQVTDSYLVALAKSRGGQLATMDKGLTMLHPGDTILIPET